MIFAIVSTVAGVEAVSAHRRNVVRDQGLSGIDRLIAETIALTYIGFVALVASVTGAFYVLFPELGALSHDVFTRPRGTWAKAPVMIALTPVLTGAIGIAVTVLLPYGMISVLTIVCASIALVLAMNSPVAPAISAGLLPLVLGVTSWWYPPGILFGTTLLAGLSIPWKRYCNGGDATPTTGDLIQDSLERSPHDYRALIPLIVFVVLATFLVELTNLRFILFPPLVVIGFEMFGHPKICPWAARPLFLPVACFLTAAGGLLILNIVGLNPATAALSMAWGIVVLRVFDLHVPPALAVALLPMVMDHPTYAYPISVGIGTLAMTLCFLAWKALTERSGVSAV